MAETDFPEFRRVGEDDDDEGTTAWDSLKSLEQKGLLQPMRQVLVFSSREIKNLALRKFITLNANNILGVLAFFLQKDGLDVLKIIEAIPQHGAFSSKLPQGVSPQEWCIQFYYFLEQLAAHLWPLNKGGDATALEQTLQHLQHQAAEKHQLDPIQFMGAVDNFRKDKPDFQILVEERKVKINFSGGRSSRVSLVAVAPESAPVLEKTSFTSSAKKETEEVRVTAAAVATDLQKVVGADESDKGSNVPAAPAGPSVSTANITPPPLDGKRTTTSTAAVVISSATTTPVVVPPTPITPNKSKARGSKWVQAGLGALLGGLTLYGVGQRLSTSGTEGHEVKTFSPDFDKKDGGSISRATDLPSTQDTPPTGLVDAGAPAVHLDAGTVPTAEPSVALAPTASASVSAAPSASHVRKWKPPVPASVSSTTPASSGNSAKWTEKDVYDIGK